MIVIRRVHGESMLPTLPPGKIVLALMRRNVRQGDVVIIKHDGLEKIKRVTQVQSSKIFVQGDNPAQSTDSHTFGWLPVHALAGKVIWPRRL